MAANERKEKSLLQSILGSEGGRRSGHVRLRVEQYRGDILEALAADLPLKTVWEKMRERGWISFSYDTFRRDKEVQKMVESLEESGVRKVRGKKKKKGRKAKAG